MKYIVSGYIGFDNFGDEAIASVLIQKLKKAGAEKITYISSKPKKTSEIHGVNSCSMLGFLPSLIKSDILISGGGSLLQDKTSLKSLIYYLLVIFSALVLRKKVQIYAQGIGPINSKLGQIFTKLLLKRVNEITVRDKKSQELLNKWGIPSLLVKDPVFDMEIPQNDKKDILGVQLRAFDGVDEIFLDNLARAITKYFPHKKIQIISLQDRIDLEVCNNFEKILKTKGLFDVEVLSSLSINEAIDIISSLEYLIAMRFHANVIGVKSEVKTLAINYDPKVEKLAEEYHLPLINSNDKDFSHEFERLL